MLIVKLIQYLQLPHWFQDECGTRIRSSVAKSLQGEAHNDILSTASGEKTIAKQHAQCRKGAVGEDMK